MFLHLFPRVIPALILFLAALASGEELTAPGKSEWSIGLGLDVASGSYGNETTTRFVAIPLLLQYAPSSRLALELDLPWVYQSNSVTTYGTVGSSHGQMANTSGRYASSSAISPAASGRRGGGPGGTGQQNLAPDDVQSGIGDATLSAEYALLDEGVWQPRLGALLSLKIPLANENKGLGTGEFDEGIGLSLAKSVGFTRYFARGSYILRGDSPLYEPKNYLSYAFGGGYLINLDLQTSLALIGATAPFAGAPAPLEGQIRLNYRITNEVRIGGYLGHGLSDGSPDLATGIVIMRSLN